MTERQVRWRRDHVSTDEPGVQNRVTYPWLLPRWAWQEGLWPPLRGEGPGSLQAYLAANRVRPHSGVHNLKSSWVSGVNLYFPFGASAGGRALLAGFLREHVDARVRSVESLDLEWAGDRELTPRMLLGETGGTRGSGQTSPDIALRVNGGEGLLLVENKLVEHSFYPCSGAHRQRVRRAPGQPGPGALRRRPRPPRRSLAVPSGRAREAVLALAPRRRGRRGLRRAAEVPRGHRRLPAPAPAGPRGGAGALGPVRLRDLGRGARRAQPQARALAGCPPASPTSATGGACSAARRRSRWSRTRTGPAGCGRATRRARGAPGAPGSRSGTASTAPNGIVAGRGGNTHDVQQARSCRRRRPISRADWSVPHGDIRRERLVKYKAIPSEETTCCTRAYAAAGAGQAGGVRPARSRRRPPPAAARPHRQARGPLRPASAARPAAVRRPSAGPAAGHHSERARRDAAPRHRQQQRAGDGEQRRQRVGRHIRQPRGVLVQGEQDRLELRLLRGVDEEGERRDGDRRRDHPRRPPQRPAQRLVPQPHGEGSQHHDRQHRRARQLAQSRAERGEQRRRGHPAAGQRRERPRRRRPPRPAPAAASASRWRLRR